MADKSQAQIKAELKVKEAQIAMNKAENEVTLRGSDLNVAYAELGVATKDAETDRIKEEIDGLKKNQGRTPVMTP